MTSITRRTARSTVPGSWADSPNPIIQVSHSRTQNTGTKTGLPRRRIPVRVRSDRTVLVSAMLIVLANLTAALNLLAVYGSPAAWAVCAIPAALIGIACALAGLNSALRLWWQLLFLVVAQFVVGPVIALPGTTVARVIPTLDTLSQGASATLGAFKYIIAIEPAVGTGSGDLMALWTVVLWSTFLSGVFAFTANALFSLLSLAIVMADLAVCAALGTSSGFHPAVVGVLIALAMLIWMSWRMRLLEANRLLAAVLIVVLAAAGACGAAIALTGQRQVLRDHYEPPLSPYDYTSPLSGLRSYVKDHKDDKLLTVTGLPAGTPVRLAVMDRFDGSVWNLSDSSAAFGSSDYRRVGDTIGGDKSGTDTTKGKSFTATFTVHNGLSDVWMPLAGTASSVSFGSDDLSQSFYYNTGTESALLSTGLRANLTYTERGVITAQPNSRQIAGADAAAVNQPKAQDVPESVKSTATSYAGGESKDGAAAQKLADKLKDNGWFSHGLQGDYPSLPGHGAYRIDLLLGGDAMVGDSEQYASAMALMARELGLPSRVVMGFLPKDSDGGISDARTTVRDDGTTSIDFTGNDIAAWVEIKLDGYGWVAFYPTPKETKIPDDDQNLTPPNPQTLVRQPPVPLEDPLRDQNQTKGQTNIGGSDADANAAAFWRMFRLIAGRVALYGSPVWIVLLVVGVILLIKTILLRRARGRGSPGMRIAQGWRWICMLATQSGATVRGTRREQSRMLADQFDLPRDTLDDLSRRADRAAFSGEHTDERTAAAYWQDVDRIRERMLRSMPKRRAWATRLSVRGLFADPVDPMTHDDSPDQSRRWLRIRNIFRTHTMQGAS
ncbi:transglutaminase domain-containing protein [Bifidobacterium callimiconis]|uniref:DUF3488 and transglutaminase-like domain-containing protein n=1 Tax=Bifidobacterium callimiconis TaxID=2306973 RepID=UPI001BDCB7D3|nr:transglutaminase domain-containing protein [Bifidobacterium callimiconis]MBT1176553.1 transglutaminase domain-containing protein [Bifidobacterium callimiconis]